MHGLSSTATNHPLLWASPGPPPTLQAYRLGGWAQTSVGGVAAAGHGTQELNTRAAKTVQRVAKKLEHEAQRAEQRAAEKAAKKAAGAEAEKAAKMAAKAAAKANRKGGGDGAMWRPATAGGRQACSVGAAPGQLRAHQAVALLPALSSPCSPWPTAKQMLGGDERDEVGALTDRRLACTSDPTEYPVLTADACDGRLYTAPPVPQPLSTYSMPSAYHVMTPNWPGAPCLECDARVAMQG